MQNSTSNVVPLSKDGKSAVEGSRNRASIIVAECREQIRHRLAGALPAMMDQIDDSLFELAEKSDTNTSQSAYFEAMREIRLKRSAMEETFARNFVENSRRIENKTKSAHSEFELPAAPELSLGLVDNEDMEESLAVTNMVSKVKSQCREELFAFDRRVSALLNTKEMSEDDNPLGAKTICDAFKEACTQLDVPLEIKLLVLKLFDKFVVSQAQAMYHDLNELLIAKGVLPKIRQEIKRQPNHRGPVRTPGAGVPPSGSPYPPNVPHAGHHYARGPVSSPEAMKAAGDYRAGVTQGGSPVEQLVHEMMADFGVPSTEYDAVYDRAAHRSVMGSLTSLQQGRENAVRGVDHTVVGTGMVNVLHDIKASPVASELNKVDNIMIDVVAMMFDFIFDDVNIPPGIKALIGRLQIPVLKVAIIDKTFFSSRSHPVRKLLNTLGGAAMQWNRAKERDDRLLKKIEQLVERILNEFTDDVEVFVEVLEDLEAALAADRNDRTARVNEQAKALQRAEQLRQAGAKAEEEVGKRLERTDLYPFIRNFLTAQWREFLTLIYMREGAAGDGWRAGLDTMDDLLWSIAPKPIAEDRSRLASLLPRLLERLKAGTSQIAVDVEERKTFLDRLSKIHIDVVTRGQAVAEPELEVPQETESQAVSDAGPSVDGQVDEPHCARKQCFTGAVKLCNQAVFETAASRSQCKGMGTTIVAAKFEDTTMTYTHVGDSRLYRLRDNRLTQLSRDHSLRQHVIDKGYFTPEEAAERVPGHVLSRAIGGEEDVIVDVEQEDTKGGDIYLLCSDGLSDLVDPSAMARALVEQATDDLGVRAQALVDLANEAGGRDNITVILAEVSPEQTHFAGVTDVGRRRAHNEDHYAIDTPQGVVVLADGMGGCKAGEVASHIATGIMLACLTQGSMETVRDKLVLGDRPEKMDVDAIHSVFTGADGLKDFMEAMADSSDDGLFDELAEERPIEEIELADDLFGESPDEAEGDEATRAVKTLKVGNWVEFNARSSAPIRAHLSWISPGSGVYLFTDRRGRKVADPNQHGLMVELRTGDVRVVDDVPLIDKVWGHMSSHLRDKTVADYDEHAHT